MRTTFTLSDFLKFSRFYIFRSPPQAHLAVLVLHIGKTDGQKREKGNGLELFNRMIYLTEGDY